MGKQKGNAIKGAVYGLLIEAIIVLLCLLLYNANAFGETQSDTVTYPAIEQTPTPNCIMTDEAWLPQAIIYSEKHGVPFCKDSPAKPTTLTIKWSGNKIAGKEIGFRADGVVVWRKER